LDSEACVCKASYGACGKKDGREAGKGCCVTGRPLAAIAPGAELQMAAGQKHVAVQR
jgi:hypothetical protein